MKSNERNLHFISQCTCPSGWAREPQKPIRAHLVFILLGNQQLNRSTRLGKYISWQLLLPRPPKKQQPGTVFSFAEGGKGVGIPFFGVTMSPSHPAVGWYAQRHLNLLLFLLRLAGITLRRRLGWVCLRDDHDCVNGLKKRGPWCLPKLQVQSKKS